MSSSTVRPYLFFGGRCEEALRFYESALGAKIDILMYYKDSPEPPPPGVLPPGFENKVMHAGFRIGDSLLMASDGCDTSSTFSNFSLSVHLPSVPEVERAFAALSEGGRVKMPLSKTFWSPCFGMLSDAFGMDWMLTLSEENGTSRAAEV